MIIADDLANGPPDACHGEVEVDWLYSLVDSDAVDCDLDVLRCLGHRLQVEMPAFVGCAVADILARDH